ncbi:MAG: IS110 family transposase [Candidatus Woesearchaeota archaeon]
MFCGIDVSKNKSQVCILKEDNTILKEFEITHTKDGFELLEGELNPDATIAMETTGTYSKAIYDYLKARYNTIYVDNGQMHMFAKLHFSHMKNDKIDARLIAKYLSFGLKRVNPIKEEELKDLGRLYEKTIYQMTKYKHMFKNQINIIFPELETHFHLTKAKGLTSLLIRYPSPQQIARLSDEELAIALTSDYKRFAHLPNKDKFITQLKDLASKSIGIKDYPTECFTQTIKILKFYEATIDDIRAKIKIAIMSSPYNKLLNEFGYDDISLASIVGEIGDIRRFSNHKKFVAYCGLNVSEKQSGKSMSKNCYITKRGNKLLRHTFYLMVLAYLNYKKDEHHAQFFNKLKESGKHPKQCVVAVARKLAIKCFYDMQKCHIQ